MADLLQDLAKAGERPVAFGGRVAVVNPNGENVTIGENDLETALKSGYTLQTPEGHHEETLQARHGDDATGAFLGSAANSATFGLADLVRTAGGGDEAREAIAAERRYNPTASSAGEIAGLLSPVGAGGLIGKAGSAVGKRAAGTALVEGLMGGGALARAAGSAVKLGVQAGTEGAIAGVGQTVSQVALSEDPMSAEAIASALGSNMLYGASSAAGVGAGLGGLGSLAKSAATRARSTMTKALETSERAASIPDDVAAMDRPALKAAQKAETEAAEAAQKTERTAVNEDLVAHREQLRGAVPTLLAKSGTAGKGLAREVIQAERGLAGVIDVIPEAPGRGLSALRKVDRALGNVRKALPDEVGAQLDDLLGRNKALAERLEATMKAPGSDRLTAIANKLEDLANPSLGAQVGEAVKDKALGILGGTVGSLVGGGPVGGLVGAALGVGFGAFKKRLGASAADFGAKLNEGIAKAMTVAESVAPTIGRKVALGVSFGARPDEGGEGRDQMHQRARDVLDAVADLQASQMQVHDGLTGIRAVDNTLADQVEQVAMRKLQYLAGVAPKAPPAGMGTLGHDRWQPADAELSKFARVVAVTEQPMRILDALASDTLTPDVVEAVKNVYPELFKKIGLQVMDHMVKPGAKPLSDARRLGLAMLTGAPVDTAMSPTFVRSMQDIYAKAADTRKQQQRPPSPQAAQMRNLRPTPGQDFGG